MRILISIPIIAFLLIGALGCGGAKSVPGIMERPIKPAAGPPKETINLRAYDYYSTGSILDMMGEFYLANEQYAKALKYYPGSDEIRYAYANSYFNLRDFENALFEAKKLKYRDLRAWYLLANCHRALGNRDSAMVAYYKVVELDSGNAQAYYQISNYYREAGNIDSTIWGFENIARINPTPLVFQQLGNMYIQKGDIDKAEENYKYSLSLDASKENLQSYLGLSAIYENRGDMPAAKEILESVITLAPEDMRLQGRLLDMYVAGDEYFKAIETARRILSVMPNDDFIARRLAMMYFDVDSLQTSDSIFTALIERGDNNLVNHYYAGRIALFYRDLEQAKSHFMQLTVMADSVVDGWLNLGYVYRLEDSVELEVAAYNTGLKYVTNVDDSVRIMFNLGATLEQNGRFDEAVTTFEKIIDLIPNHSQALNYLGFMLAEKGVRLKYARGLIERALEISPDNGAFIDSYGWVLYKMGEYKKALNTLLRAYQLEANDPVVTEHLGDAYAALGDMENAHIYWKKALELNPDNESLVEKLRK
ncbi:MAG: hypothetical protein CVT49_06725 [candidate division Zixibacteria bacterium HGW-Zixibacteria-1]|nr:MAG: hypothetical protein CVT49_06725 [candidate division Zixibacteria bacterium HGW-Zixibacteria-1]